MAPAGVTDACCADPPAVDRKRDDYELKGSYKPYGSLEKAYVTGDPSAKIGIIFVYDIFGFHPTTQQGADILARESKALVIMPDFAHGEPYDSDRFTNPPEGVEPMQEVGKKFFDPSYLSTRAEELKSVADQLRKEGKSFVGAHGLCWGGRVVFNAGSQSPAVVNAVSTAHPAALSEEDAEKVTVPVAVYPSQNEDAKTCEKIVESIKAKPFGLTSDFKNYPDMHHGWAGAHAHLDDDANYKQYQDVYGRLATFFTASAKKA